MTKSTKRATGKGNRHAWIAHVKAYYCKHPDKTFAECMKLASTTYNPPECGRTKSTKK